MPAEASARLAIALQRSVVVVEPAFLRSVRSGDTRDVQLLLCLRDDVMVEVREKVPCNV